MSFAALKSRLCFLSGNTLKIIAALAMIIDHIGVLFYPAHLAILQGIHMLIK